MHTYTEIFSTSKQIDFIKRSLEQFFVENGFDCRSIEIIADSIPSPENGIFETTRFDLSVIYRKLNGHEKNCKDNFSRVYNCILNLASIMHLSIRIHGLFDHSHDSNDHDHQIHNVKIHVIKS